MSKNVIYRSLEKKDGDENILHEQSFFLNVIGGEGKNLGPDKEPKPEIL